jgi:high-affinity iron transporter
VFQQAILISFREGLESFLIVGVILAYLRRTGRSELVRGVQLGVALSLLTCTVGAYFWYRWTQSETSSPNQALYEGIAAFLAAGLVGALLWQTLRAGKHLRGDIEARIERAASRASWRAVAGTSLVTSLLITREGLEAVLFLGVQAFTVKATVLALGAGLGLLLAAGIAWSWSRFGYRLQMGVVLRVTAIFLVLFLAQLVVYGLHELAESAVIPGDRVAAFHTATERLGPQGDIGQWFTFSLAGAPLLYLALERLRSTPSTARCAGEGRGGGVPGPEDRTRHAHH